MDLRRLGHGNWELQCLYLSYFLIFSLMDLG